MSGRTWPISAAPSEEKMRVLEHEHHVVVQRHARARHHLVLDRHHRHVIAQEAVHLLGRPVEGEAGVADLEVVAHGALIPTRRC
ncbi:MAG: hypothetical protein R2695_19645 [Acidimicrobiales bacterium]